MDDYDELYEPDPILCPECGGTGMHPYLNQGCRYCGGAGELPEQFYEI